MKRAIALIIIGVCLFIGASFVVCLFIGASFVSADNGDTGWTCPSGTTHSYKIDGLSGPTFTVPSAPDGWEVLGVSIKAGPNHYDYPTAQSGDVINVKLDIGHDTSHAHICKREKQWESTTTTTDPKPSTTTTTPTTSTTSTTTPTSSSTIPATSTSVIGTSTTSTTEVVSTTTNPVPTSSVQESTSTSTTKPVTASSSTPSTSSPEPGTVPSSSTTLPSQPTVTSEPGITTVQPPGPSLPATGGALNIVVLAVILMSVGIILFVWTWRE